jgi:hypothetical protein
VASPQISHPECGSITVRKPLRIMAWSSAMSMRAIISPSVTFNGWNMIASWRRYIHP